jgi:hypothetical protein
MKDWNLIRVAVDEALTFVTNNARDFRRLHAMEEAHAGLVILIPCVEPPRQRELFEAVLDVLEPDSDLFNEVIEVQFEAAGDSVTITRLALAQDE